jgi:hypothetical protein
VRLRWGQLALVFGLAVVLVALAGLLYVIQTITGALAVITEIGAHPYG